MLVPYRLLLTYILLSNWFQKGTIKFLLFNCYKSCKVYPFKKSFTMFKSSIFYHLFIFIFSIRNKHILQSLSFLRDFELTITLSLLKAIILIYKPLI